MRLHRLRMQAFGPFAGTEEIDFDQLAAAGLHLIHGPTGAGKTSILDAICFALFAGVPGGRMQGRDTLHSDHADPASRPEVELEFGVGDRRLRVRRSPEHQVPKKRGTGTRAQRGSVLLEERRGGSWQTLSTRNDEVAQTIGDLLGMGLAQFAQVMLLPQGEFTAFLRAKPDDRGRLLERLFDISEFAAVEQWLVDHRKRLETQVIQARSRRATLVARARDVLSGVTPQPPPDGDVDGLGCALAVDDDVESAAVLHELVDELSGRWTEALTVSDRADGTVERLRERLVAEQTLAALQRHAHAAQQTLDQIADQAPQVTEATDRLAAAARAERCGPAIAAFEQREKAHQEVLRTAAARWAELVRCAAWPVPEPHRADGLTEVALEPLIQRAAAGTAALAGQAEVLRQLRKADQESAAAAADLLAARRDADRRQRAIEAADTQVAQLGARRVELAPDAMAHPQWRRLLDELDTAAGLLEQAIHDVATTASAHREHRRTRQAWTGAEHTVLQLRTARLAGIAAELAAELRDGRPCPVCGSADHPHRAAPAPDHVDAEQVAAAEEAAVAAKSLADRAAERWATRTGHARATCRAALDAVSRLTGSAADRDPEETATPVRSARADVAGRLAALRPADADPADADPVGEAGDAPPSLDLAVAELLAALKEVVAGSREETALHVARTASAVQQLEVLDEQLDGFDTERSAARQAAGTAGEAVRLAEARLAALESQRAAGRSRIAEMTRAHQDVCGCAAATETDADTDTRVDPAAVHAACADRLDRLRAAATAERSAAAEAVRARAELSSLLDETGFDDAATATQSMLSERDRDRLESLVAAAQTAEAKATGVLEQPEVVDALAAPTAAVDQLAEELTAAERTARHARDAVGEIRHAHGRLQQLATELSSHDQATAPLREELAVADSLAGAIAGSGDNTMRMRLTAYVLAARLETVTELANERLHRMTDGRYQLEHTDARAARGSKSGLGLRICDAWTGTTRDTATLSGGESFITSLALALGLGDAVLEAAGGRRLETLLVDEGFGSLDEDSLEQVLDVLDGLRDGGRSVGIVSHVAELRVRIPAQIRVRKTAHGSTLQVVTTAVA